MKDGYEKRQKGLMFAIVGMSRCGKTTYTIAKTKKILKNDRLIVWDPAGQLANALGCQTVRDIKELYRLIKNNKGVGRYAFNYIGGSDKKKVFSDFCYIAFYWGILKSCTVIAEELGQVTDPAKASGYWHTLTSNGLKYGINILAIAQRTQEIDNTLLGNCSYNVQFAVNTSLKTDIKRSVEVLGEKPPKDFYYFVEKNNQNQQKIRGKTLENGNIAYKS